MTLDELFKIDPMPEIPAWTHVARITLSSSDFSKHGLLDESRWTQSRINGLYIRVDPVRPDMKQLRHVHVAAKRHINAPNKQVAWNSDGSRHDRKSFDDTFGQQRDVKAVARAALGLPSDFILEYVENPAQSIIRLLESASYESEKHLVSVNI